MGFPLSRFQHLSSLCKEERYTVEEFAKYRLTAIVLHKSRSSAFRRVMQENFEHLHTATGRDFAFITFLDPPESWAEEHRSWMETREALVADSGNYSSEAFLEALCSRLSIQKLPAIILTDNLNSSRYAVLQTDSRNVVGQMERIGEFASAQPHRFPVTAKAFTDMLGSLGEYGIHDTLDSEFLSTNIADIMAAFSMDGSGASTVGDHMIDKMAARSQKDSAKKHIKEAMSRNRSRYESLRNAPVPNPDEIDTARDVYSSYMALVLEQETASRRPRRPQVVFGNNATGLSESINDPVIPSGKRASCDSVHREPKIPGRYSYKTYFTKNSLKFYKTYQVLKSGLTGQMRSEFVDPDEDLDYSYICVELCKIVEEELNASVVQMIRQYKGIPMPEFYRVHCAAKGRVTVAKNLINLQDMRTQTLRQIPIGGILCMLESLDKEDSFAPFNTERFLAPVRDFKEYRNDTPHPVVLEREDFREMDRTFDALFNEWMESLYRVKQTLQGHATPSMRDN